MVEIPACGFCGLCLKLDFDSKAKFMANPKESCIGLEGLGRGVPLGLGVLANTVAMFARSHNHVFLFFLLRSLQCWARVTSDIRLVSSCLLRPSSPGLGAKANPCQDIEDRTLVEGWPAFAFQTNAGSMCVGLIRRAFRGLDESW